MTIASNVISILNLATTIHLNQTQVIIPALNNISKQLAAVASEVDAIDAELTSSPATHIALELPTRTRKGKPVPNFELPNDEVVTITIKTTNSAGMVEPMPAGDVFTVTSNRPASLNAVMGTDAAGNPAVVINALVQTSPGVAFTVSDSAGLAQVTQTVDIVADVTPTNIVLDLADATHTTQPVPTNPGP